DPRHRSQPHARRRRTPPRAAPALAPDRRGQQPHALGRHGTVVRGRGGGARRAPGRARPARAPPAAVGPVVTRTTRLGPPRRRSAPPPSAAPDRPAPAA